VPQVRDDDVPVVVVRPPECEVPASGPAAIVPDQPPVLASLELLPVPWGSLVPWVVVRLRPRVAVNDDMTKVCRRPR
jgi:hypothetical protein